jgi:hypothetical protein
MVELEILSAKPTDSPTVLLRQFNEAYRTDPTTLPKIASTMGFGRVDIYLEGVGAVLPYFWVGNAWKKHPETDSGVDSSNDDWTRFVISDQQNAMCLVSNGSTDGDSHGFVGLCN